MNPRFKVGDRIVANVWQPPMIGTVEYVFPEMTHGGEIQPGYLIHWDRPLGSPETDYDLAIEYGLEPLEES